MEQENPINGLKDYLYVPGQGPIFHYTTAAGFLGIFNSKTIWATNIFYLNDFSELIVAIQQVQEKVRTLRDSFPKSDHVFLDELGKQLADITQSYSRRQFDPTQNIFISAFSINPDQLSQWRSYSPEGHGYSVGFEFKDALYDTVLNKQKFHLVRCLYSEQEHDEFTQLFLKHALDLFHEMQNRDDVPEADGDQPVNKDEEKAEASLETRAAIRARQFFMEYAPMLKHAKFSEEAEWRLISLPKADRANDLGFREGKSVIVPYLNVRLAEENDPLPCCKIVIGPTPYPELSEYSVKSLLAVRGYDCPVELSAIPFRVGGLEI